MATTTLGSLRRGGGEEGEEEERFQEQGELRVVQRVFPSSSFGGRRRCHPRKNPKMSTTERPVQGVPMPVAHTLRSDVLFKRVPGAGSDRVEINIPALKTHFYHEGKLEVDDVLYILNTATEILRSEPNVLHITSPINRGPVGQTQYLFLGDYVDRGSFSVEVLLYLYSLKIQHRDTFFLIRGNHECHHLTEYFTFKEECERKYNHQVYETALQSFNALPLCAVIDRQFLCIHGGISPDFQTIDDIMKIDRFREPPLHGPMCDILWSDPAEDFSPSNGQRFALNNLRGCSYVFTYFAACEFLERNGMLSILRAHEAQDDGYHMCNARASTGFPTVITIFSAPNYLDTYNNSGAIAHYDKGEFNIRQFNNSPHPYWLPNFADAFSWSLPFVTQKVKDLIVGLLKLSEFVDDDDEEEEEDDVIDDVNGDIIFNTRNSRVSIAKYRNGLINNNNTNISSRSASNFAVCCSDCGSTVSAGSGYGSCGGSGNSSSMEVSDSSEGTSPSSIGMGNICMKSKRVKVMTDQSSRSPEGYANDSGNNSNGDYYCCRCRCNSCESLSASSYHRRRDGYLSGSNSGSGSGSGSASPMEIGAPLNGPSGLLSPKSIPSAMYSSLPSVSTSSTSFSPSSSSSSVGTVDFSLGRCSESPVICRSCGSSCGVISGDGGNIYSGCGSAHGERGIGGGYLRGKGSLGANDNRMRLLNNYDCIMPLSSSSSPPARSLL